LVILKIHGYFINRVTLDMPVLIYIRSCRRTANNLREIAEAWGGHGGGGGRVDFISFDPSGLHHDSLHPSDLGGDDGTYILRRKLLGGRGSTCTGKPYSPTQAPGRGGESILRLRPSPRTDAAQRGGLNVLPRGSSFPRVDIPPRAPSAHAALLATLRAM